MVSFEFDGVNENMVCKWCANSYTIYQKLHFSMLSLSEHNTCKLKLEKPSQAVI